MLKINDLKKGDKLYCIKNFITTKRGKDVNSTDLNKCIGPLERAKYIQNAQIITEQFIDFIKDKTYTITSIISTHKYVKAEYHEYLLTDEVFLNKYFISQTELRKQKLEKLKK